MRKPTFEETPVSCPRVLPRQSSKWWVLLGTLALLGTPYLAEARSPDRPARRLLARDTTQTRRFHILPLHFRTADLISTEYLQRALQRSGRDAEENPPAKHYAQRYRIPIALAQQILDVSLAEGIDPELGFRLVRTESRFQARARGPSGSLGLTQLMPSTARSLDPSLRTEAAVLDPRNNLRVGFRYLRSLIEQFGDVRLGLLAYNRGEGTVKRVLRAGADPENGYSSKVLGSSDGSHYRGKGVIPRQ